MSNDEIFTTKPFMPPFDEYTKLVRRAFDSEEFTNHGGLLTELEKKLEDYLKLDGLQCVTSATTGLQMAIKALGIEAGSEIITAPFSYVATTTAILAEKCVPVYADIEPDNFNLDADKIEPLITEKTKAIMPVHIFGYPCNTEKIEEIAKKYNLKVIYDAAHAFGARYKGKSILEYGDISVVSMQESKLFHTVEGGIIYSKDKTLMEKINLLKQCGHIDDNFITDGFNARLSELHAAMGLANIKYIDNIIEKRKKLCEIYDRRLANYVKLPKKQATLEYKYPYYVIVLKSVEEKDNVMNTLCENGIYPWHCYYPTLNTLPYLKTRQSCPVAEDVCARILQMPLYYQLETKDIERVCDVTLSVLRG